MARLSHHAARGYVISLVLLVAATPAAVAGTLMLSPSAAASYLETKVAPAAAKKVKAGGWQVSGCRSRGSAAECKITDYFVSAAADTGDPILGTQCTVPVLVEHTSAGWSSDPKGGSCRDTPGPVMTLSIAENTLHDYAASVIETGNLEGWTEGLSGCMNHGASDVQCAVHYYPPSPAKTVCSSIGQVTFVAQAPEASEPPTKCVKAS